MTLVPSVPGLLVRPVENAAEMVSVRQLHSDCYVAEGYVSADDLDEDGFIDDPWIPFSDYYVAIDTMSEDQIVGTCRIIRPSVRGFPAFQECVTTDEAISVFARIDPSACIEVSALATPRVGMQNMAISAALYGLVWHECVAQRRAYMLAVMDDRLLRIMRRWFEFPFEPVGDPCHYMGSASTPVSMYIPRTIEVLAAKNPDTLRFFSGDIPFDQLNDYAINLRTAVPEHRSNVIDLRSARAAT